MVRETFRYTRQTATSAEGIRPPPGNQGVVSKAVTKAFAGLKMKMTEEMEEARRGAEKAVEEARRRPEAVEWRRAMNPGLSIGRAEVFRAVRRECERVEAGLEARPPGLSVAQEWREFNARRLGMSVSVRRGVAELREDLEARAAESKARRERRVAESAAKGMAEWREGVRGIRQCLHHKARERAELARELERQRMTELARRREVERQRLTFGGEVIDGMKAQKMAQLAGAGFESEEQWRQWRATNLKITNERFDKLLKTIDPVKIAERRPLVKKQWAKEQAEWDLEENERKARQKRNGNISDGVLEALGVNSLVALRTKQAMNHLKTNSRFGKLLAGLRNGAKAMYDTVKSKVSDATSKIFG